jgi:sulfite exporter TauE/SafE
MTCFPVLAPVFAAEERTFRATWSAWFQLLGGRLVGYLVFGALAGWLGQRFGSPALQLLSAAGMMAMAAWLAWYAAGFRRPSPPACPAARCRSATPVLLGFLLSTHICPPVLMSVAYVFTLQSAAMGLLYFFVFFCATSLYFLPLPFIGILGRIREFRWAARLAAGLVGLLFLGYGAFMVQRLMREMIAP